MESCGQSKRRAHVYSLDTPALETNNFRTVTERVRELFRLKFIFPRSIELLAVVCWLPFDVRRARPSLPCSPTVASFQKDTQICVLPLKEKFGLSSPYRFSFSLRFFVVHFFFFSSCLSRQNGCCAFVCNIFYF